MFNVFECLEALSKTTSKKDKELILKKHDDPVLREFLLLTYNKYVTYRIQQVEYPSKYATYQADIFYDLKEVCRQLASHSLGTNAAKAVVKHLLAKCTEENAKWIARCITRDLNVGIDEKTINKVYDGLIPVFSCQLANKAEDLGVLPYPLVVEEKLDGVRTLAVVENGLVKFLSREGREFSNPNLEVVKEQVLKLFPGLNFVLDGEMIAMKVNTNNKVCKKYASGNWKFNYGLSMLKTEDTSAREIFEFLGYYVWDVVDFEYFISQGKRGEARPLTARKAMLATMFENKNLHNVFMLPNWVCMNQADVKKLFKELREQGCEGAMIKPPSKPYEFKRSDAVLKLKEMYDADLVIVGAEEGDSRNKGKLGALFVESSDGKIKTKVGSGFDDSDRDSLWYDFNEGTLVGKICAVTYQEITKDNSLRFPVFQGIRWDKTEADSSEILAG